MTTNKLYWMGGKEKIQAKILSLEKSYSLDKTFLVKYVEINRKDAGAENLKDGDIIGTFKIKLSDGIISNHFLFILDNKP